MIGARLGSPLAVGYGEGEMFLGSDAIALCPVDRSISYLEDGDSVVLTRDGRTVYDAERRVVHRIAVQKSSASSSHGRQGRTIATSWRRRSTNSPRSSPTR